jgi:hydroxymethylpyrimidine pyrophosphatase-like HAD family hydrolase
MPKIKLVGLDFDKTLYSGPASLMGVRSWLEQLSRQGIKVGLVTGRTFGSLQALFQQDGYKWGAPFPDFAICFESRILDASGDSIRGCERWNTERDADTERAHAILSRELPAWKRSLEADGISCATAFLDKNYGLFLEFDSPEHSVAACEKLSAQADPNHGLRLVRNYSGLSIHAGNRSKGPALACLVKAWGIEQDQTLVIGDSLNDLCMMNGNYRYQVATIANADPIIHDAVKKRKGIIATKNCSEGVVEIFEKVFGNS